MQYNENISTMLIGRLTGGAKVVATFAAWFLFVTFMASNVLALTPFEGEIASYIPETCGLLAACAAKFM